MPSKSFGEYDRDRPANKSRRPSDAAGEQSDPAQTHVSAVIRRAASDPRSLSAGDMLSLQRTIGNRRVTQMMKASTVARQGRGDDQAGGSGTSAAQNATFQNLTVAGSLAVGGALNVGGTLNADKVVAGTLETGNLIAPNAGSASQQPQETPSVGAGNIW